MDNILNIYLISIFFITGLCLGSFYNVVIIRSLKDESIVYPPSKCPHCGNKLKPWHNIPVISYILLKGKCAFCGEKISIQYPIVELITGILFCFAFIKFGLSYKTFFVLFWLSCIIIMTATDLKEKIVDCNYAIAIAISGFIYKFLTSGFNGIKDGFLGLLVGFLIIEAIARLGYIFKKGRAMGEADSYVTGAIGAIAGLHHIIPTFIYSMEASMLFILPVFWHNRYKEKDAMTLLFSALFIMSISFTTLFYNAYWPIILLIIFGLILIFLVIKQIKTTETPLNYLPFVPALSVGFLCYILFVL